MIDTAAFQGKRAAYYTLGCKLNFSETSTFGQMLSQMGVVTAEKGQKADLVLINTPLKDDFGTQLAIDVCVESSAGALLFVKAELYDSINARVMEYGVVTLSMPSATALVSQSLRMLCAQRERLRRMEQKQQSVEDKIEEIRLVNRAKWLLIECLSMTEADAQRYIERQSMDQRITKRRAAENIIKTYS
jgi:response regulator NasT